MAANIEVCLSPDSLMPMVSRLEQEYAGIADSVCQSLYAATLYKLFLRADTSKIANAKAKATHYRQCAMKPLHLLAAAKDKDYERAAELLKKGDVSFSEGHDSHLELLGREAEGEAVACLLVMHAEDQLMSAEAFKLVAQELIDVYKEINKK